MITRALPIFFYLSDTILKTAIKKSKILEPFESNEKRFNEELENALSSLKNVLNCDKLHLLNIFKLDSEDYSSDIELSILNTVFNCKY